MEVAVNVTDLWTVDTNVPVEAATLEMSVK